MAGLAALSPAERHHAVSAGFTEHVDAVRDWDLPTPVDGWVARDVVAHLIDWFSGFLRAGGVDLAGGPPLADGPAVAWRAHADSVQALLDSAAADTEFTHPMAGAHRLADAVDRFYTADVFMHTWDLAAATGRGCALDPDYAAQLLDGMTAMDEVLRASGQYGPAVAVDAGADAVTRLVGFIGRDPQWPR